MTSRKVCVSYEHEGNIPEVLWAFRERYFAPTDDERTLKRLDDDGEVVGFLIHKMSMLKDPSRVELEMVTEAPADDAPNIMVKEAASRSGVSERSGRTLRGNKAGAEWLIPILAELIPGRREPVRVVGREDGPGA